MEQLDHSWQPARSSSKARYGERRTRQDRRQRRCHGLSVMGPDLFVFCVDDLIGIKTRARKEPAGQVGLRFALQNE
jgi:hypothetical protein